MDLQRFSQFLSTKVSPIPAWLNDEAALLTAHLTALQRSEGISGPVLEIGVFKGKYLSVLYELSTPGGRVVGVDLFVGAILPSAVTGEVRRYIATACGDDSRLRLLVGDSTAMGADTLREEAGSRAFR